MLRCDQTQAWKLLGDHFAASGKSFDVRTALAQDASRVQSLSQAAPHIFADLSKNRIDSSAETLLFRFAEPSSFSIKLTSCLKANLAKK